MAFAVLYLVRHFFFHIAEFFRHWYANTFRIIGHWLMNNLEWLDQTLALRVTLRHLFDPLYGDYTITGRIIGPMFRVVRILIALILYPVLMSIAIAAYVVWAFIPLFLFINILYPSLFIPEIQRIIVLWIK